MRVTGGSERHTADAHSIHVMVYGMSSRKVHSNHIRIQFFEAIEQLPFRFTSTKKICERAHCSSWAKYESQSASNFLK
jgi:hypothetical protein